MNFRFSRALLTGGRTYNFATSTKKAVLRFIEARWRCARPSPSDLASFKMPTPFRACILGTAVLVIVSRQSVVGDISLGVRPHILPSKERAPPKRGQAGTGYSGRGLPHWHNSGRADWFHKEKNAPQ